MRVHPSVRPSVSVDRKLGRKQVSSRAILREERCLFKTANLVALIGDGWRNSSSNLQSRPTACSLFGCLAVFRSCRRVDSLIGRDMLILLLAVFICFCLKHDLLASYFIRQCCSRNTPRHSHLCRLEFFEISMGSRLCCVTS